MAATLNIIARMGAAAAVYFLALFALGFALGTARVLWLEPRIGEVWAVAVEAPLMIAGMWFAAPLCARLFGVPAAPGARVGMGLLALAMLLTAEIGLSGESAAAFAQRFATAEGLIYLAMLAAFAAMPLFRR